MARRPLRPTAILWSGAKRPGQKFRDRIRITLSSGEAVDIVAYGPTKRAATDELYDKVEKIMAQDRASNERTVTQVMADLLRHKRSVRGRKRKTIFNDLDLYKRHVRPHIGHLPISQVTLEDLQEIQMRLTSASKWRTAELATIQLRSIYKHALRLHRADVRAGRLALFNLSEDLDPIQRPSEARHKPNELWTFDDLGLFLTEAKRIYDASLRNLLYPFFHTAIAAGLRRGELLGLKRSDFISENTEDGAQRHYLRVAQQLVYYGGKHHKDTPKSASGERIVPIGPELAAVLQAHVAKLREVAKKNPEWKDSPLLFPSFNGAPIQPRNLYRARDTILAAVNKDRKPKDPKVPRATLHELRGLYATYVTRELVRQGRYSPKLVMQLLGHSHPDVALKHYNRVVKEDLQGATFDPPASGSVTNGITNADSEGRDATVSQSEEEQREGVSATGVEA